jgi:hypothetical protein
VVLTKKQVELGEIVVAGDENFAEDAADLFPKLGASIERIIFKARQHTIGEAIWADIYDNIVGFVPVAGTVIGNGPRINDAVASKDAVAGIVHAADAALVEIPSVGMILDLIIPANLIVQADSYVRCMEKGGEPFDCFYPKGTFERDVIDMVGIDI